MVIESKLKTLSITTFILHYLASYFKHQITKKGEYNINTFISFQNLINY